MKAEIHVTFDGITRTELLTALQGLRDVEQKDPTRIDLFILVNTPDLTTEEVTGMLNSLKPPLPYMEVFGPSSTFGANREQE
jgi:hypothetical protein